MRSIQILPLVAGGLILIAGCNQNPNVSEAGGAPPATIDAGTSPAIPAGAQRASTDALPPLVSAAFYKEYPTASVTGIAQNSAETGTPIYRITFIDSGHPGAVTYFNNGSRLTSSTSPSNLTAPRQPVERSTPYSPSQTPSAGKP